jgi:E3 ubiquitin-protein ligase TRIP12
MDVLVLRCDPDGVFDHKGYTEKALNKLIKAKAKADRAASRREARDTSAAASTPQPTSANGSTDPTEAGTAAEPTSETPSREEQAETLQIPAKDQVVDRNELLRSKPEVVGRFMQLMVPVLIDVYAASVITSVRLKTLTGLLKAVGFLDTEDLKRVFSVSALHRLPIQMLTKFTPSSFLLLVSRLQFCHQRTIPPSF